MEHCVAYILRRAQWLHAFYLGKLCEKLEYSPAKAFSYYSVAITLNPTAVDPVYRMHASRMKLLYTRGKHNLDVIQVR
jgi:calcineurin-binding protein cabin-1